MADTNETEEQRAQREQREQAERRELLNQANQAEADGLRVQAIELPKYMPDYPKVWLAVVKAQFSPRTQEATKYGALLRALAPTVLRELLDVVTNNPTFEDVSAALIKRFDRTDDERLRQLFNKTELGDLKPSQLLRRMNECAADQIGLEASIIPRLWREHLPPQVQDVLEVSTGTPEELAAIADRVIKRTREIHAVSAATGTTTLASAVPAYTADSTNAAGQTPFEKQMLQMFGELKLQVEEIQRGRTRERSNDNNSDNRGRSRTYSRGRSRSRPRYEPKAGICWYHFRFGAESKKCVEPCKFKKN